MNGIKKEDRTKQKQNKNDTIGKLAAGAAEREQTTLTAHSMRNTMITNILYDDV